MFNWKKSWKDLGNNIKYSGFSYILYLILLLVFTHTHLKSCLQILTWQSHSTCQLFREDSHTFFFFLSIVALQYSVSFCCTTKWISVCIHISPPPWTFLPLHPPSYISRSSTLSTFLSFFLNFCFIFATWLYCILNV